MTTHAQNPEKKKKDANQSEPAQEEVSHIEAAEAQLKKGEYEAATAAFNKLLAANAKDQRAQRGVLKVMLETGNYVEAETTAKKYLAPDATKDASNHFARLTIAEVMAETGRYAEAIAEFERVSKATTPKEKENKTEAELEKEAAVQPLLLRAELRRGELLNATGKPDEAQFVFQGISKFWDDNTVESAEGLTTIATALAYLEKPQEAKDMYLDAITADEANAEAHIAAAELFTAKYAYADAAEFLKDALKLNPNSAALHLAIARNKRFDGGEAVQQAIAKALSINPNLAAAKLLAASTDLDAEKHEDAAKKIDDVLKLNPNALEAHALRAASHWVNNRTVPYETALKAALAINPKSGELYETLAHYATNQRRYDESIVFLRKAVELTPNLWNAHLALGQALLRTNKNDEGRAAVETSFKGDPFNPWAKNTLEFLDTLGDFRETTAGDFVIRTHEKESTVLAGYAADLLTEAKAKLTAKYKFTPTGPIVAEFHPNHDDFAVRALGLPGLGALGVCFGQQIVQDSPSARAGEGFNWGSTLWHEYTHVITLQITDHRIPRWFSEGLSVFEEHKARPGWGDDWSITNVKTLADGRWFKINDLDGGFMRPKKPDDVQLAYFEASQVCHFIEDKFGFDAILAMLKGYKDQKRTPDILREALKLTPEEFDTQFMAYVQERGGKYIKTLAPMWAKEAPEVSKDVTKEKLFELADAQRDDFAAQMRAGSKAIAEKNDEAALKYFRRATELFPLQSEAYEALAGIYERRGDKAAQIESLEAQIKVDENDYAAHKKLAQLKLAQGDKARGLELLKLGFFINPFDHALHTEAGTLLLERKENEAALREYQVALGTKPPNFAEAHFNVARAYSALGKAKEAKRAVLQSLELAPGFDKAQDLLLQLTEKP
ncbi:MAG: tetratricopeptide repeat protein [Acidobacteria bacterium]|nr:tetratricopeptide repeat protein [Acidobacteriota bacterium]